MAADGGSADSQDWLAQLRDYSLRSPIEHLSCGGHLADFVEYLHSERPELPQPVKVPYAVLYDFQKESPEEPLHEPAQLGDIRERNETVPGQSQLLFLRGHPTREWIKAIGNTFGVEGDFFFHHMRKFSRNRAETAHSWPPLPSNAVRQPRFHMMTLGRFSDPGGDVRNEAHVNRLRERAENFVDTYLQDVRRMESGARLGDSLLRGFSVHDGANFSHEQCVSIWMKQTEKGWFALAWLDIGTNAESRAWLAPLGGVLGNTMFTPTAVGSEPSLAGTRHEGSRNPLGNGLPQNAKHLCSRYDAGMDRSLAKASAFYALLKFLQFVATSEMQFLNMIRRAVHRDVRVGRVSAREQGDAALSNLHYNHDILHWHAERLRSNVRVIRNRMAWPRSCDMDEQHRQKVDDLGSTLMEDFQYLGDMAEELASKCHRGAQRIMQLVSHAESKKQLAQAERLERLTQLATIFIPASWTASFFGINSAQFGQGTLPLWVYFAVTIPLLGMLTLAVEARARDRVVATLRVQATRRFVQGQEV